MRLPFAGLFQRRTLRHGPEAAGLKAAALSPGMLASGGDGGRAGGEPRSYAALARRGFLGNPVAHRCIRLVCEAAAQVPFVIREDGVETGDHPLASLLARPNPHMGGAEFLETIYGHLMISGNAFLEPLAIGQTVREAYVIRPDRVRIEAGADGWRRAYLVDQGAARRRLPVCGSPGDPVHIRLFHPLDDQYGFGPLASAGTALALAEAAGAWNRALLRNSARPSGALVYQPKEGGNLSPGQYERLKQELEEGYSGSVSAGRPLLLEGGLDWKPMALTPRDMDFTEARNGAARDIALALGVPPMLLGIPGDNTYANYQEAHRALYRLTVLPMVNRTLSSLAHGLGDPARRITIEADLDQVPALSAERGELWSRVNAAGFLSEAEKRQAVGYDPQPAE